ncbi:hypothetical protein Peur_031611 [Populus x canadensis]
MFTRCKGFWRQIKWILNGSGEDRCWSEASTIPSCAFPASLGRPLGKCSDSEVIFQEANVYDKMFFFDLNQSSLRMLQLQRQFSLCQASIHTESLVSFV